MVEENKAIQIRETFNICRFQYHPCEYVDQTADSTQDKTVTRILFVTANRFS